MRANVPVPLIGKRANHLHICYGILNFMQAPNSLRFCPQKPTIMMDVRIFSTNTSGNIHQII
jgi:hypothetical protein